nr:ABC transporter ATP-binding protein [uncultured Carboxylicivirga sp.]
MKDFFRVLRLYIPPYKYRLLLSFIFNILGAAFIVSSMMSIAPMLQVILQDDKNVTELVAWSLDKDDLLNNVYYYITIIKTQYGAGMSLLIMGLGVIILTFFKNAFTYMGSYTMAGIRNGVTMDIRNKIYRKLVELPLGFYSDERKGDMMARTTVDVQEVEASIMSSLDMFLKNPIIIIVVLGSMLYISLKLTLFVFLVLPIMGFIIGRVGKNLKKTSREGQNKMGEILNLIEETISGLRIIKAFNAENRINKRFFDETDSYRRINNRLQRRRDMAHPMSELLGTVMIVIIVWYGGSLILEKDNSLDFSFFLAYLAMFYQIINPAKAFSQATYNIQKGMAAYERIEFVLNAESSIKEHDGSVNINGFKDKLEYRNIRFSYNNEVDVLKDVSLTIPQGKTIALVGQSGSGKTTFVDLLPRFYDVQGGGIYIDGHNIKDLKLFDLRELMGNVNQEAILFNDTIYNNITFGVENATMEEVIQAAKVANAHDFIESTEEGYQTKIGDRGSKLSGGQRQRLSIARAILKNPPILILDEATSALDTESERLVQDALEKLMQNRTSLVIAHRLSTVRNADMICVFNEGKIVETGTHDELIALNGIYNKLHSMQMS